ncbi:methyl-accepting chemotaxis protein [Oxalobacteraceae bacterium A2-2]
MLKDLGIKTKLAGGLGAIVAILLILLVLAYTNFSKLSDANGWDRHTLEVLLETNKIETSLLQVQSSTRGFVFTGDETLTKPIAEEEQAAFAYLEHLRSLTRDNPGQQERLQRLDPLIRQWLANVIHPELAKRRALNRQPGSPQQAATPADILNSSRTMGQIRVLLDQISAEEQRLLAVRSKTSTELQQAMNLMLIVGGCLAVLAASVIGYTMSAALLTPIRNLAAVAARITGGDAGARATVRSDDELGRMAGAFNTMAQTIQDSAQKERALTEQLRAKVDALLGVVSKAASGDLTGKVTVSGEDAIGQLALGLRAMLDNLRTLINNVQKAGIQVTTSATEIAASAKQQEATGVETAQTSVEILSTTKEISANTQQLLKSMEEATSVADYTTRATADAQANLHRMDDTMQAMVAATDTINAKLAALSDKASNINSVLTTITKVADQTNILSLNAAIEAEKAGEAGRGFSVVATEIRRLADQTSVSTWDIEQMLKEMQSAVSASVMGMDKFSEEIRRSVSEVREVTAQLSAVMEQVQKLAPQFEAVLQGMQSQAVGAEQITSTMMQLNDTNQQTVESLKSTSEAVMQLQYAAGGLQSSVATFAVNAA